jgi:hypothetical protein
MTMKPALIQALLSTRFSANAVAVRVAAFPWFLRLSRDIVGDTVAVGEPLVTKVSISRSNRASLRNCGDGIVGQIPLQQVNDKIRGI